MSTPTCIVIPDLFVSFLSQPPQVNPHYETIKAESQAWIAERCNYDEQKREKYRKADFAYCVAVACPNAEADRFRTVCDWIHWIFDFDDLFDDGVFKDDPEGARQHVRAFLRIMDSPDPHATLQQQQQQQSTDLLEIFRSIWLRVANQSPPGLQQRFKKAMTEYADGVVEQVASGGEIEDLDAFFDVRRKTVAMAPFVSLVEYAENLQLPDDVFECEAMKTFQRTITDIGILQNDICSWNKEQAQGETHNTITLYTRLGLSSAQSFSAAESRLRSLYSSWFTAQASLPLWGEAVDALVQRYFGACRNILLANIHWSFHTERYFGSDNKIVRQTRVVRVMPRKISKPSKSAGLERSAVAGAGAEVVAH